LLIADQFEEIYTLCTDAEERKIFLDGLLQAVNNGPFLPYYSPYGQIFYLGRWMIMSLLGDRSNSIN
jgi:hypothetical protein